MVNLEAKSEYDLPSLIYRFNQKWGIHTEIKDPDVDGKHKQVDLKSLQKTSVSGKAFNKKRHVGLNRFNEDFLISKSHLVR